MTLKVGIVGAGKRVRDIYLPVLRQLAESFEVVGVVARTRASADRVAASNQMRAYDSISALCHGSQPELLIVAVDGQNNSRVAVEAIAERRATLLETPIAIDPREGRAVVRAASASGRPVGVAEQKPFLPLESLKSAVIDSGALGRIVVAENHFRSLEYHAFAQLRRYLRNDAMPVWVQAVRLSSAIDSFVARDGVSRAAGTEMWKVATVAFHDGSLAVHHFSTEYKKAPFRLRPSLRVYGSRGSIADDEIAVLDSGGATVLVKVSKDIDGLTALLPNQNQVSWKNPVANCTLDDDQIAVAQHLVSMREAVTGGARVLYGPHDALIDVEIVDATERSARKGGSPVFMRHSCADPVCRPISGLQGARARAERAMRSTLADGAGGFVVRLLRGARRPA